MIRKLLSRNRLRKARKAVSTQPSPSNYAALAAEFVLRSEMDEAARACEEGLRAFPGSAELARVAGRIRRQMQESRLSGLRQEISEAPRPALWREYCDLLLGSGQIGRAEAAARDWLGEGRDPEAQLMLARVMAERLIADRGREIGQLAFESLDAAEAALPRDARPLKLRLRLSYLIGAWDEAKRAVSLLLDLMPGEPALEARFRLLESQSAEGSPNVDQALRTVERTGELYEDVDSEQEASVGPTIDVRGLLRQMSSEKDVKAAVYMRGATALIQGPKGGTAERTARVFRAVMHSSRTGGRRLGLGQLQELRLEGEFGHLRLLAGERDAAALWTDTALAGKRLAGLIDLVGSNAETEQAA